MALAGTIYEDDRITIDPDICNGKPGIRNSRITVETILGFLSAGDSAEEILRQYPSLQREHINASLAFAARLMHNRYSVMKIG